MAAGQENEPRPPDPTDVMREEFDRKADDLQHQIEDIAASVEKITAPAPPEPTPEDEETEDEARIRQNTQKVPDPPLHRPEQLWPERDDIEADTDWGYVIKDVGAAAAAGTSTKHTRSDHVHRGVSSVILSGDAAKYGQVTLDVSTDPEDNIGIVVAGNTFTFEGVILVGAGTTGTAAHNAGTASWAARSDHEHAIGDINGGALTLDNVCDNGDVTNQIIKTGGFVLDADDKVLTLGADGFLDSYLTWDGDSLDFYSFGGIYDFTADTNTDLTFNFVGTTSSGVLKWMEDEDYFKTEDDIFVNASEHIYFYDTAIHIAALNDGHLDLTADTSIDLNSVAGSFSFTAAADTDLTLNFAGTTNSGVLKWMEDEDYFNLQNDLYLGIPGGEPSGGDLRSFAALGVRAAAGNGVFIGEAANNWLIVKPAEIECYTTLNPDTNKGQDIGEALVAWDDVYADDFQNVADFAYLDDRDDLAALQAIKPSNDVDPRTGLTLIDDDTLPEWLLTKDKAGKDVLRDPDGKPYVSLRTMCSLLMGAVRQLGERLDQLGRAIERCD